MEGHAVFEEITTLVLCASEGGCRLSSVLGFYPLAELTVSSNVSSVQIWLPHLKLLLRVLLPGGGTGLRVGVKILSAPPAGFGRAPLLMPQAMVVSKLWA